MARTKSPTSTSFSGIGLSGSGLSGTRGTSVTLPIQLLQDAKELAVNISAACAAGLEAEVRAAKATRWLKENRREIDAYNDQVEERGLPLAKYRTF
jgi:antitoxin CcdA